MDNYHYIIAGLPALAGDFTACRLPLDELAADVRRQLSPEDNRLVDWLEFGLDSNNLSEHFYRAVGKKTEFLSQYFQFDRNVRNAAVQKVAEREHLDAGPYTVGPADTGFEEYGTLSAILDNEDILARELLIDRLRWAKISEIAVSHYFDMDVILAFMAKARIVQRWSALDPEKGERLFAQLLREVRGTSKGTDGNESRQ